MNSHRDNVKDEIRERLENYMLSDVNEFEEAANIADAVFDALGITDDEQDGEGGYFMLYAAKGERPFVAPKPRDEDGCIIPVTKDVLLRCKECGRACGDDETINGVCDHCFSEGDIIPEDSGEYEDDKTMIEELNQRHRELKAGAKYTSSEFKAYAKAVEVKETMGLYVTLQTPICKYGQAYSGDTCLDEAKTHFVNYYYNMYLADYERSQELAEMDKE